MAKAKHQYFDLPIPRWMPPEAAVEFAQDAMEIIRRRTASGKDKDGNRFPKYSPDYVDSAQFKRAGKSKSPVNLKMTGDMMASMDILDQKKTRIRIGFEKGSEENAKAEGNALGSYGGKPNPEKARPFLGMTKKEYNKLLRQYEREYGDE